MNQRNYSDRLIIAAKQNVKEKEYWLKQLAGELVRSRFPHDRKEAGNNDVRMASGVFRSHPRYLPRIRVTPVVRI